MAISRLFLLRMRNVPNKVVAKIKTNIFSFSDFFPKIVPFMRECGGARGVAENMAPPRDKLDK